MDPNPLLTCSAGKQNGNFTFPLSPQETSRLDFKFPSTIWVMGELFTIVVDCRVILPESGISCGLSYFMSID